MPDPVASAQTAEDIDIYAPPKANLDLEAPYIYIEGCSRAILATIIADQAAAADTTK